MTIITPDKNILYIIPEYPVTSGCQSRIAAIVEKLNNNFQIKNLIQIRNYNPQIKKLLNRSMIQPNINKSIKQHQNTSKHVLEHPIRFKRGK